MMSKRVSIKDIARELSYAVIICQSHEDRVREEENIRTLISNHVAGIVMSLSKETDRANKEIVINRKSSSEVQH